MRTGAWDNAFPESYVGGDSPHEGIGNGMTLREYFAAKAMQGISANPEYAGWEPASLASRAVRHADALIAALNED